MASVQPETLDHSKKIVAQSNYLRVHLPFYILLLEYFSSYGRLPFERAERAFAESAGGEYNVWQSSLGDLI